MSIESKLAAFLKSPAGEKKIAEAKKSAVKEGRPFGQPSGTVISKAAAAKAGHEMREILHQHLVAAGLGSISLQDIYVSEPKPYKDGYEVAVWFEPDAVKRASLDPYRFPEGVDNIVRLFSHGWDTRDGRVSGIWHGEYTYNKTISEPKPFMQEAVNAFNQSHVENAELNEEYT